MIDRRKLSSAERKAIAQKAAAARWAKLSPRKPASAISVGFNLAEFCRMMAVSCQLPPELYEKPMNFLNMPDIDMVEIAAARAAHIIQLGHEVGLQPAQSLASISVKRGKPLINGDTQLALVLNSGKAEYVKEYTEGGDIYIDGQINPIHCAVCETLRIGDDAPHFSRFSIQDAINAELWGKPGTWQTHRPRMLKYKARAFGLRDKYADVLKGMTHSMEEMEGESLGARQDGIEIAPHDAAKKLSSIIDKRLLHNTTPEKKEG